MSSEVPILEIASRGPCATSTFRGETYCQVVNDFVEIDVDTHEPSPGEITLLIERFLALKDQGVQISIEELCKSSPHLTRPVSDQLQAIQKIDLFLDTDNNSLQAESLFTIGKRSGTTQTQSEYLIEKFHANGGCSEVYIARDTQLGRRVAIKFLRPDVENIKSQRQRLQREAEITSRLDHPGIVSIHAHGNDDRGVPFYTMRFVDGHSMASQIHSFHQQNPNLSSQTFLRLLRHFVDVCQTVAFAHSRNVIHRDIKPDNIVTGSYGETYVIDWGLARIFDNYEKADSASDSSMEVENSIEINVGDSGHESADPTRLTQLGNSIGTPAFMSPEQARGENVTPASDTFNLGATLYTLLTGSPPYSGDTIMDVIENARQARYRPPRSRNTNVPPALSSICQKAMSKTPKDRYASPNDLAEDIERFLADQTVTAYQDPWRDQIRRWIKRHRTLVTSIVTTGIAALVILSISIALLLDANRHLANRESEANFHKSETQKALEEANENLYVQHIALAHSELTKNNLVRAEELLNACPQRFRSWEWRLLKSMVDQHKPLATISLNNDVVHAFDISADGEWIAVGDPQGTIHFFENRHDSKLSRAAKTDPRLRAASELNDGMKIHQLAISPNGKRLLVVGRERHEGTTKGVMRIWDLPARKVICENRRHGKLEMAVAWSDDGTRIVTAGIAKRIRIRDAETLTPVARFNEAHASAIRSVSFVKDSTTQFVSASESGLIRCWNADETLAWEMETGQGGLLCMTAFSDSLFYAGSDKLVHQRSMQDVSTRNSDRLAYVGNRDQVTSISVSADGRFIAAGGLDRNIRIWETQTGELVSLVQSHSSHLKRVLFDRSGRFLLSAGDDGGLKIWDAQKLLSSRPDGHQVSFSNTSNQLILMTSQQVALWDAEQEKPIARYSSHSPITTVAYGNQSDSYATLYLDGSVEIRTPDGVRRLESDETHALTAVFNHNDSLLFVSHRDGTLRCWDLSEEKVVRSIKTAATIRAMGISADQNRLIAGLMNGTTMIWDVETLESRMEVPSHAKEVRGLAIHPLDSVFATTGADGMIKIWNSKNGQLIHSFRFGASWLNCLSFTPDGKRLVTGSEHSVLFWDMDSKKELFSMSVDRCVHSISFSHDGRYFSVAGEDPKIRLWDLEQPMSETASQ